MAVTGRTGADAVFKSIKHVCSVINRYSGKFNAVIIAAQAAGAIDGTEAALITTFLATLTALCDALDKLAAYSGF